MIKLKEKVRGTG